jgi:Mn2+/Fe2+ NRAMP family transporter
VGTRWKFDRNPRKARFFYVLLGIGVVGGVVIAAFVDNPIGLLVFSAVVNGIAAAPFLIVTMLISGDRKIMGPYTNGKPASSIG